MIRADSTKLIQTFALPNTPMLIATVMGHGSVGEAEAMTVVSILSLNEQAPSGAERKLT